MGKVRREWHPVAGTLALPQEEVGNPAGQKINPSSFHCPVCVCVFMCMHVDAHITDTMLCV